MVIASTVSVEYNSYQSLSTQAIGIIACKICEDPGESWSERRRHGVVNWAGVDLGVWGHRAETEKVAGHWRWVLEWDKYEAGGNQHG